MLFKLMKTINKIKIILTEHHFKLDEDEILN